MKNLLFQWITKIDKYYAYPQKFKLFPYLCIVKPPLGGWG